MLQTDRRALLAAVNEQRHGSQGSIDTETAAATDGARSACEAAGVRRRRRYSEMCACRRRSGGADLAEGWACVGNEVAPATACEQMDVRRRRRQAEMCSCRRRSGGADLPSGWTCKGNSIALATPAGPTMAPTPEPPLSNPTWFGSGRVTNAAFWSPMRGIGFSPADARGEWFMSRDNPSVARLDDALSKVVDNGYNMVRTWRTGAYEDLMFQRIRDRSLDIKVQLGVDIAEDWHARQLIDEAVRVARKYPELVLGLSVGNERMHFGNLYAEQVLEHARYARNKYNIPVTYNFVLETITSSRRRAGAARSLELCQELDYVNVHLYGTHYRTGRYDASWTPRRQVEKVKAQEAEVVAKIGAMGKPMIIGETGWQSRGYVTSSVGELREYYIRITRHVYSDAPDSPALAMFYFNLNDEAWKGHDDAWGLYEQGTADWIGDSTAGAAKFVPTNVTRILETASLPKPAPECCAPPESWQGVMSGVTCEGCTALVATEPYGGRCDMYCASFGHECASAAEELSNDCDVMDTVPCDQEILGTSDMLCTCRLPNCSALLPGSR